jgi:hypothetical protein
LPTTPTAAPTVETLYFAGQQGTSPEGGPLLGFAAYALVNRDEPVLTHVTNLPACRLVWERSFHGNVIVRAEMDGSGVRIFASSSRRGVKSLFVSDASAPLRQAFERACFWSMPLADPLGGRGCDGSSWLLEAFDGERHHVVERWSILKDADERGLSDYRALCLTLLELSQLQTEPMY